MPVDTTKHLEEPVKRPREFWDGINHAFIPDGPVDDPEGLRLHRDAADDIDPVTYEVIRHGLWNANMDHVRVIENLGVSPITVEIRDFQTCILTEDAEVLYFGPCLQYMSGMVDMQVRFVMERHGDAVRDGDMWLCNDPIVGTAHQPDVGLLCPVFVHGKLFCWVGNIAHQNDIGGTVPGSFCPNAQDVFWDPPSYPPFRIVKDGRIDPELEAIYRRSSRTPEALSLDLRATIAGNLAAKARVLTLVQRYGEDVVKGVMRRVIDASERAFKEMMDTIPDGRYSERMFNEVAMTGDRGIYPVVTTVTKRGHALIFDNVGTHAQVGAINVGFAGWRGAILGAINVLMLADQMGCAAGAVRHMEFRPEPGTITCPDWGAAVSPAGIYATEIGMSHGMAVVTKMMLASTETAVRDGALTATSAQWAAQIIAGVNQRGAYYVGGEGDNMLGAGGATWRRDGQFADGHALVPEGRGPNVEVYERDWPILYLYRREFADSAGAGRCRSGNGGELAYLPHNGHSGLGVYTNEALPKAMGILGGDPGAVARSRLIRDTNVRERFAAGEVPQDIGALGGREEQLIGKGPGLLIEDSDVLYWNWLSPAGYGDPLTRDPDLVARDVGSGTVTVAGAERIYGVVLREGRVHPEPTAALREQRLRERLSSGGPPREPLAPSEPPDGAETIGDAYLIDRDGGLLRCLRCATSLGAIDGNPKEAMVLMQRPLGDAALQLPDPAQFVDAEVVWREFCCPGCGVRLATEVAEPDTPILAEIRLAS